MRIVFSHFAKSKLKAIYKYYKVVASKQVADDIKNGIIQKSKSLREFPEMGSIDEHLSYLKSGHRKLIEGNYKIVYRITDSVIFITDIFDTRQDPEKQTGIL